MTAFKASYRKLFGNLFGGFNLDGRLASFTNDAGSWSLDFHEASQLLWVDAGGSVLREPPYQQGRAA